MFGRRRGLLGLLCCRLGGVWGALGGSEKGLGEDGSSNVYDYIYNTRYSMHAFCKDIVGSHRGIVRNGYGWDGKDARVQLVWLVALQVRTWVGLR